MCPVNFKVEKPERLIITVVTILALTVLMVTGVVPGHGGLEALLYCAGYTAGGQWGPSVTRTNATPEPDNAVTSPPPRSG